MVEDMSVGDCFTVKLGHCVIAGNQYLLKFLVVGYDQNDK